jgi:chromosome segregation protein
VEPRYTDAIEAALGRRLQAVIVSDLESAEKILVSLREGNLGKATILAESDLQKEPPARPGKAPLGALAWAADRVQCDDAVKPLVSRLLAGVLLVEDLATALRLRESGCGHAMATLDGEYLTPEGIFHGGRSGDESTSVLRMQSEIRELRQVTEALDEEVDQRQRRRDELNHTLDDFEVGLQAARERLQQKRIASSSYEGKLAVVERDLSQLENRIESLDWEQREVEQRAAGLRTELEAKRAERESALAGVGALDDENLRLSDELAEARLREDALTEEVTGARTRLAVENGTREKFEEQRAPMLARIDELNELLQRRESEIVDYRQRIDSAAAETATLQEKSSPGRPRPPRPRASAT